MTETANIRMERIEKLLRELEYEVTRGMMEREIGEEVSFRFVVPASSAIHDGIVMCEFTTRPVPSYHGLMWGSSGYEPKLRLVKG